MLFSALQSLFSCCRKEKEEPEEPQVYDETTHLIPIEHDPPIIYSDDNSIIDHVRLYQQLGNIVRAKEEKMVNVASRIPFNLHNQVIPKEQSYSASASRSTSCSMDGYDDERYHPLNAYLDPGLARKAARRRKKKAALSNSAYFRRAEEYNSRSPSPSNGDDDAGPSTRAARSSSCVTEQPRPTPILNVRLVGYKETRVRGRTLQRGPGPSGLPSSSYMVSRDEPGANEVKEHTATSDEGDQPPPSTPRKIMTGTFKLPDIPLTMSWGD